MRINKSLFKKIKLKNKQWYHQRFDGCPYLIHIIAENELKDEPRKKYVGAVHTIRVCFFENDRADWYIIMDDIKKTTSTMIELVKTDNILSKKLLKAWENDEKLFFQECRKLKKLDLKKLSTSELINLAIQFFENASHRFTSSSVIDGFALGSDEIIAKKILDLVKKRGLEKSYPEIFSKLTAPVKQSFINEAEISMLEVAKLISKNKELRTYIENNSAKKCIKILEKHIQIHNALKDHIKKYYWSRNNYVMAYILDEEYIIKEIKEILESKTNIQEQIDKIKNTPRLNQLTKMELIKKLKIDKHLKNLIRISEDFTWWQDKRKKASYLNAHYTTLILEELSKRTNHTLHELKMMSPREILNIPKNLKQREKKCAFIWKGNEHVCLIGKDFDILKDTMFGKIDHSKITEISGLCASVGKVIGKVKICKSATEVDKVKEGDILVAIMTRPDYVAGMKRAKAIVTNEGGITSHAAIVSRELGIPCVIGTKIATEVLKEDDLIEVDANNGIVKILKRA